MTYKQKLFGFAKSRLLFQHSDLLSERRKRCEAFERRNKTNGCRSAYE